MPSPLIEKLLVLQEKDRRRLELERQLRGVPADLALVETAVAREKAAIEGERTTVRELESAKKLLETEIGSAEQQLGKYRTQQMSVRKNDEYQALTLEIQSTQGRIGEMEGRELEIMYSIDEARKRFAAAEAVLKGNIAGHEERMRVLKERQASLGAAVSAARPEVSAARSGLDSKALSAYDRAAARGMPAVVPVHEGKCGGCHLKVSSEVESIARGKAGGAEPDAVPACEHCTRIVYWEK